MGAAPRAQPLLLHSSPLLASPAAEPGLEPQPVLVHPGVPRFTPVRPGVPTALLAELSHVGMRLGGQTLRVGAGGARPWQPRGAPPCPTPHLPSSPPTSPVLTGQDTKGKASPHLGHEFCLFSDLWGTAPLAETHRYRDPPLPSELTLNIGGVVGKKAPFPCASR